MRYQPLSTAAVSLVPAPDLAATVERARAGDAAAIRALIELYQGRVGRFVLSMLRDDSEWEDVAQVTFVKMILGIERLQSVEISSRGCSRSRAIPAWIICGAGDGVEYLFRGSRDTVRLRRLRARSTIRGWIEWIAHLANCRSISAN